MMGLTTLGWDDRWSQALAQQGDDALRPARVVAVHRGRVAVLDDEGEALLPVRDDGDRAPHGTGVGVEQGPPERRVEREQGSPNRC